MKRLFFLIIFLSWLLSSSSWALTFFEFPDAGELPIDALSLPDFTDEIIGSYEREEADMFFFYWPGGEIEIYADAYDPQLFLFDEAGVGIWGNDDGGSGWDARIYDSYLAPGNYYLAISGYNRDPYSASGRIFPSSPFDIQHPPSNTDPISYWSGTAYSPSDYTITFNSPVMSPVPEPSTAILTVLGLGSLLLVRRFKK